MIIAGKTFNLPLSRRLGASAEHAYDTIAEIKARGAIPIYEPRLDLQAVIEPYDDCNILAFRGTRSLKNWRIDVSAIPTASGIHSGFYEGFNYLNELIIKELPNIDRLKPLYSAGHSLGGPLAVQAGVLYKADALYTFNQPRLYTYKYLAKYADIFANLNFWRVVDQEDIISHLPGLLAGYRHTGGLALINDKYDIEINSPAYRQIEGHIQGISADLCRVFYGKLPRWVVVRDHFMDRCMFALNEAHV